MSDGFNPWELLMRLDEPEQRPLLFGFGGLLLALLGAYLAGPGPWNAGLTVLVVVGAPLLALSLGAPAGLLLLLVATAGGWISFDASGSYAPFALPGLLLRELAYFATPPLAVHLLLDAEHRDRLKLGLLHIYAPMVAIWAGVGANIVWRLRQGLEPVGAEARQASLIYGMCCLVFVLLALVARWRGVSDERPQQPPAASALALEETGRFGMAARAYEREAQFEKGAEMARRAGDWGRAAELLRRSGDMFGAGEMFFRAQMWNDALEAYERARAWPEAARLCLQQGLTDQAVSLFEKAGDPLGALQALQSAGRQPTPEQFLRAGAYAPAAAALEARGEWGRAAEIYESNLRDVESALRMYLQAGSWLAAGRLLESRGRLEEAAQAYLALPAGALDAARIYGALGKPEQAAELLAKLPPGTLEKLEDEGTLTLAAKVLAGAGRHEEAIRILQSLKRRGGVSGSLHLLLGRSLLAKGLPDLAEEELRVATSLPLEPAQELEASYLLGCVLETNGQKSEALATFHAILQKDFAYADVEQRYRRLKAAAVGEGPGSGNIVL